MIIGTVFITSMCNILAIKTVTNNSNNNSNNTKKIEIIINKDSTLKDTVIVKRKHLPTLNDSTLMAELKLNNIKHSNIVLAQAKLETGHYTSPICKTHNNLFGLMRGNKYRRYNHWTESVKAYKDLIQSKYDGGNYYVFLKNLNYAKDPNYIDKLKNINA
jgi:flagellum-specific peptidoglycan hydrolase FlgJ